jgi:hypothetical protein
MTRRPKLAADDGKIVIASSTENDAERRDLVGRLLLALAS